MKSWNLKIHFQEGMDSPDFTPRLYGKSIISPEKHFVYANSLPYLFYHILKEQKFNTTALLIYYYALFQITHTFSYLIILCLCVPQLVIFPAFFCQQAVVISLLNH